MILTALLEHGPSFQIEGYYLINFLVFFGGLVYFLKKPLSEFASSRRRRIVAEMEEAQRLRAEAETKLAEYESRLAHLEEEMARVLADARAAGEADRKRILVEATLAAARIRQDAKTRIEQETKRIQHELEVKAVEMAMGVAEKLVAERLTEAHRRKYVADYISDLEHTRLEERVQ